MYVCPECGSSSKELGFCASDGAALEDASRDPLLGRSVGSYRIEDAGIWLFESVTGADPTSIMGLPLLMVCALLRAAGLHPAVNAPGA